MNFPIDLVTRPLPVIALFMTVMFFVLYRLGKKELSIFPEDGSVEVKFSEKRIPGHLLTPKHNSGKSRDIHVQVTEDELWVKKPVLFAILGKRAGVVQRQVLKNVTDVEQEGRNVIVRILNKSGEVSPLILKMRRSDEFIKVLKEQKKKHTS